MISSINGCQCHSQGSAVWAAVRARSLLTSRCDQCFLLLLIHRNRLRGAMPAPTTAAKHVTVREMNFIDQPVQKDGPPLLYPRATRECLFARVVMFGESMGFESWMHELSRCIELFNVTIDGLCRCFRNYIATVHRPYRRHEPHLHAAGPPFSRSHMFKEKAARLGAEPQTSQPGQPFSVFSNGARVL